jgi:hypothetical protein
MLRLRLFASFVGTTVSLLALVHCGGDPPGASEPRPDAAPDEPRRKPDAGPDVDTAGGQASATEGGGSRFTPLYLVREFEDGTVDRQFDDLFQDTKLKTMCFIDEIGTSEYRCRPFFDEVFEAFADASCSEPVIALQHRTPSGFSPYGELPRETACEPRIVGLEGLRQGPVYRRTELGSCQRYFEEGSYTTVRHDIPLSTFGAFTRAADTTDLPRERSGTKLALERWRFTGEDGSFQVRAPRIVDVLRNAEGSIQTAMDGSLRFFPSSSRMRAANSFAEATCTGPLLQFQPNDPWACHADPLRTNIGLKAERMPNGCFGMRAVHEPSAPPLESIYLSELETCHAVPAFESRYYPTQPLVEIPQDSLVPVTRTIVATTKHTTPGSKIEARAVAVSSADGLELEERATRFYLTKYGIACEGGYHSMSGDERCVPDAPYDESYGLFSDTACTEAIIALLGDDPCAPASLYKGDGGSSSNIFQRPAGSPLTADTFYRKEGGGACVPVAASHGTYVYLVKGTPVEVPLEELPRVTGRYLVKADEL